MTNQEKVAVANAPAKKKKKAASLDRRKARAGWVFVMPFIVGLVLIYLPVIWDSIYLSFNQINNLQGGGFSLTWVGFDNYHEALFVNANFVQTLTPIMCQVLWVTQN